MQTDGTSPSPVNSRQHSGGDAVQAAFRRGLGYGEFGRLDRQSAAPALLRQQPGHRDRPPRRRDRRTASLLPHQPLASGRPDDRARDLKQVWFPGVHSDVGGGYPEAESGLVEGRARMDARRSATTAGLLVDQARKTGSSVLPAEAMSGPIPRPTCTFP